jgi:fructuronate reductase
VDDEGNPMEISSDPMLSELKEQLKGIRLGEKPDGKEGLEEILSNSLLFGTDLVQAGLSEKIEAMLFEMLEGPGAVRKTLQQYVK